MKKLLFIALVVAVAVPAGALGVIGVTARPALAQGPSPAQLAEQGWTCFVPPCPRDRGAVLQPGPGPAAGPAGGGRSSVVHRHGLDARR